MANACSFHIKVKGKKNACYAFMGSQNAVDFSITNESGTEDDYTIVFSGSCNWYLDAGCEEWNKETPVQIPTDYKAAQQEASVKYSKYEVQSRSKMFEVDVQKNELDIDSAMEYAEDPEEIMMELADGIVGNFCHYVKGELISTEEADCPEELLIYE